MIDSTDFHEAYESTREVLQNVPPDTVGIVGAALILGLVFFLGLSKKVGIINLNLFK
jgi:hypothetical protein